LDASADAGPRVVEVADTGSKSWEYSAVSDSWDTLAVVDGDDSDSEDEDEDDEPSWSV